MPSSIAQQVEPASITIVVADDQPAAQIGIRSMLDTDTAFRVVAECGSVDETLEAVRRNAPQVVLVDLMLSGGDTMRLLQGLRALGNRTRALVYTSIGNAVLAALCLQMGASGFLCKNAPVGELSRALREVAGGEGYLPEQWQKRLAGWRARGIGRRRGREGLELLSPAEVEVLHLIGQGYETPQIAEKIGRGSKTVETYRSRIRAKLELSNSTELAQFAWRVLHDAKFTAGLAPVGSP